MKKIKEIIKEPIDIDFEVDPRPLTEDEEQKISDFIRLDKELRIRKSKRKIATTKIKKVVQN